VLVTTLLLPVMTTAGPVQVVQPVESKQVPPGHSEAVEHSALLFVPPLQVVLPQKHSSFFPLRFKSAPPCSVTVPFP
jgi:hypothetical protein